MPSTWRHGKRDDPRRPGSRGGVLAPGQDDDRAGGGLQHAVRGAADDEIVEGGVTVRSHHDEVRLLVLRSLEDVRNRGTGDERRVDRDAAAGKLVPEAFEVLRRGLLAHDENLLQVVDADTVVDGDDGRLDDVEQNNATLMQTGQGGGSIGDSVARGRKIDGGEDRFHGIRLLQVVGSGYSDFAVPSAPFVIPTRVVPDHGRRRLMAANGRK